MRNPEYQQEFSCGFDCSDPERSNQSWKVMMQMAIFSNNWLLSPVSKIIKLSIFHNENVWGARVPRSKHNLFSASIRLAEKHFHFVRKTVLMGTCMQEVINIKGNLISKALREEGKYYPSKLLPDSNFI